jgi:hypothetical protein
MGTRSLTSFYTAPEGRQRKPTHLLTMYRQYDGYPEGAGRFLLDFLKEEVGSDRTGTVRHIDGQLLAAHFAHALVEHYRGEHLYNHGEPPAGWDEAEPVYDRDGALLEGIRRIIKPREETLSAYVMPEGVSAGQEFEYRVICGPGVKAEVREIGCELRDGEFVDVIGAWRSLKSAVEKAETPQLAAA